jgi:phospholipid/cholesterol/gamma-HCH transport system substrate-binding protein
MTQRRRRILGVVAVVLVLLGARWWWNGRHEGSYHVTAYFGEAIALYPHSKVHVMGVNAGTVNRVKVEHGRVRVDMSIHDHVPLPRDVTATISALTVIGERNVTLGPPWHPGQPKIGDGYVIPKERTTTPVEPDEALKAFKDLADAIDPAVITEIVHTGATTFGGHEASFNDLLHSASTLTADLAGQDDRILDAAQALHDLAATANARQEQLGHTIDAFSQASGLLADERAQIGGVLSGANRLVDQATSLLDAYRGTLPGDLANLSQLGLVLEANEHVLSDLFAAFPNTAKGLIEAYDPVNNTVHLGANLGPSVNGILDATLGRILDKLGLGGLTPCIRLPVQC